MNISRSKSAPISDFHRSHKKPQTHKTVHFHPLSHRSSGGKPSRRFQDHWTGFSRYPLKSDSAWQNGQIASQQMRFHFRKRLCTNPNGRALRSSDCRPRFLERSPKKNATDGRRGGIQLKKCRQMRDEAKTMADCNEMKWGRDFFL